MGCFTNTFELGVTEGWDVPMGFMFTGTGTKDLERTGRNTESSSSLIGISLVNSVYTISLLSPVLSLRKSGERGAGERSQKSRPSNRFPGPRGNLESYWEEHGGAYAAVA
jgi:hypothetical protein